MRLLELKNKKVIVVYGGGFQPFHAGHMSSYLQAKEAFPGAAFYVAASNVTSERPIPFNEKKFLAQQAGVRDPFVQVGTMSYVNDNGRKVTSTPLNPLEILKNYNPEEDVLVIVRSERDPMKTTASSYYQPFTDAESAEGFGTHAYIYVTKKHDFDIGGQGVYSGSQVRSLYSSADDEGRKQIIGQLYPTASSPDKIKKLLDRRLGEVNEVANPVRSTERAKTISPVLGKNTKQHPFKGRLVGEGQLDEFAPAGSGGGNTPRGPKTPGNDPWGGNDGGEDPYGQPKPEYYPRSSSYFEKFEADHFDKEDFDNATGVFKGYWENDNGSFTQIGYFKFDNPKRTGGDDPGMGWYYEPMEDSDAGASVKPAVDDSQQRKQQELSMINAFLKSGQTPKPGSQIYGLMKKHGMVEGVAEASLATMRAYFAGDKDARDPTKLAQIRQYYADLEKKEKERGQQYRTGLEKKGYRVIKTVHEDIEEGTGLSPDLLARYKKAAGADASAADERGDFKRGDKRFSGIIRATKKEFDNDIKGKKANGNS